MTKLEERQHAATDEWKTDSVDVVKYLERIGVPWMSPSVEALHRLHRAHVGTIPFENIDVVLEAHPGLGLNTVESKLVGSSRGGYCYEHALLFAAVLERLGFTVSRHMARVQPDHPGPYSHMMLVVSVEGGDYLADVGFGAGVLDPIPLRDGAVVDQAGWPHRVRWDGSGWILEKHTREGWEALHAFDRTPSRPVDYEVAHHYTATHPDSPFVGKPVVMRIEQGRIRKLVGTELIVESPEGELARETVSGARLGEVLRELGVELTEEELRSVRTRTGM
ncbi:N-hydroxyarylamine O-acetyltransferase [Actinopolyspora biskrensis]|uniref:N-hydroxyarylamine O-acetyltransferase n=1 Tax=Actinopolyspora biskrensis TaxID=1470178 RepID=A0A852Z082_9ACTN|nr:arylamine N-acetyltransferase [Actinopolyspora biskrensis]NYH79878.1 N-hydroxyarylamine O-acetyltransferase [Actinopolyspora biskrensis]